MPLLPGEVSNIVYPGSKQQTPGLDAWQVLSAICPIGFALANRIGFNYTAINFMTFVRTDGYFPTLSERVLFRKSALFGIEYFSSMILRIQATFSILLSSLLR